MRDFFRSPLFRCLICLVLVCCILVNVSPIRAEAFAGGAALSAVVGTAVAVTVVAGAMQALGVMPTSDTSIFEGVVNDCVDALTASGVFLNGLVSVLQLSDGVVVKNHVNQGIIQAILDWLFSSGKIIHSSLDSTFVYYNGNLLPALPSPGDYIHSYDYQYLAILRHDTYFWLLATDVPILCDISSSGATICFSSKGNGQLFGFTDGYSSWVTRDSYVSDPSARVNYPDGILWSNVDIFDTSGSLVMVGSSASSIAGVASGLAAGQIGTDIKTDYETWVEDGVVAVDFGIGYIDDPNTDLDDDNDDDTGTEISPTVPPGEIVDPNNPVSPSTSPSPWWQNNKWLNIGGGILGWTLADLTAQLLQHTQTQTQTGVGDPSVKVDTSLFGNNGNGNNVLDPDPDNPDSTDPTDPTTPSDPDDPDASKFFVDLRKFFPFCIPFDIAAFVSALIATPVAPKFHWELQDLSGNVYPIDIDLSSWDGFAELFRDAQLLLFIIGLAFKTKDMIQW